MNTKIFQVSTLQALALGYSRAVLTVGELMKHGETGLGTFEDVNGEMIVIDGKCYRALEDGTVRQAEDNMGVPFSTVAYMEGCREFELSGEYNMESLKSELNNRIEEDFGLNSMHVVRIDGDFELIDARSESPYKSMHVSLKDILGKTQNAFKFENIKGTLVCVYFPDYMDGINAAGWHLHFLSEDKKCGGHVFEIIMRSGKGILDKINSIEMKLPNEPVFDTYSLKNASEHEIKAVEQGKGK